MTLFYGLVAGIALTLGAVHLLVWRGRSGRRVYLLAAGMALAACAQALVELALARTSDPAAAAVLLRWGNFTVGATLLCMVWFVRAYLSAGRAWILWAITGLWAVGLMANVFSPYSLVYTEITAIHSLETFWGETSYQVEGVANPLKYLTDLASFLILIFVADAGLATWRRGDRHAAVTFGGSVVFFILVAGIHTPLVDVGIIRTPTIISATFVAILAALSYQIAWELDRARASEKALGESRRHVDRLMRSNLLGEFASSLAHELNQPLAAILANAQVVRRYLGHEPPKIAAAREAVDSIIADDRRASDLITQLRTLVHRDVVHREAVEVTGVVDETLALVRRELKTQSVTVDVVRPGLSLTVNASRVEMQQVLLNLLFNAAQAVEGQALPRRRIRIETAQDGGWVWVSVADGGPGLAPDRIDQMFEPFNTGRTGNIGMGLAICRRIVESHGGEISAVSGADDGAVFTFTLPLLEKGCVANECAG